MIVTIDGPAGAGKSTVAKLLAARLGVEYLDTGSLYRAIALLVTRQQLTHDTVHEDHLQKIIGSMKLHFGPGWVKLEEEDVTQTVRNSHQVPGQLISRVADSPVVRNCLSQMQRDYAIEQGSLVTEGRDQGTVVFPQANCKFFLSATAVERARRRYLEEIRKNSEVSFATVLSHQEQRDERDKSRAIAPLVPALDAVIVDTTSRSIEAIVDELEWHVRARMSANHME